MAGRCGLPHSQQLSTALWAWVAHALLSHPGEETHAFAEVSDNDGGMRFRGLDRNGDGVITRREWNGNDVSFRNHDWNGDGALSGRTRAEFDRLDRNHNRALNRDEFSRR